MKPVHGSSKKSGIAMRDFAAKKKHSGWIPPGLKNNKHHHIE